MATGRKRHFGYKGCGTDAIVFTILGVLACWGIHHWNGLEHRPFGLGRVPVPAAIRNLPTTIHRMIGIKGWGHSASTPAPANPTPTASTATPSAPTPTPTPAPSGAATPIPPESQPTPEVLPTPEPSTETTPPPTPALAVAATVSSAPASLRASSDPRSAAGTALFEKGDALYIGLDSGGVVVWDRNGKGGGTVIAAPAGVSGATRAITVGPDGAVWWVTSSSPAHVMAYTAKTKTVRNIDLTPLGPGAGTPDHITVVAGPKSGQTVMLTTGGQSAMFLDAATGAQRDPAELFPADAVSTIPRPATSAFLSEPSSNGQRSLLIVCGDDVAPGQSPSLSLWTTGTSPLGPTVWTQHVIDTGGGLPVYNRLRVTEPGGVGVSGDGIALLASASGGQTLAAGQIWTTDLTPTATAVSMSSHPTVPTGVFGLWAPPERMARGRSGIWWTMGNSVFHEPVDGGPAETYMPWNGAGDEKHGKILTLIADTDGAYVATDTGIHHIVPGHPDKTVGYGGYLRAALGPDAAEIPAGNPQKLDAEVQQWQGTPYKWGGDSRAGIDCSGYVCKLFGGVGVTIPRSTAELSGGGEGKRVVDNLQYGDILVFPGHCAMYIGNGWTTEALDAGVGKAAIWSRRNVVVKRFLGGK